MVGIGLAEKRALTAAAISASALATGHSVMLEH